MYKKIKNNNISQTTQEKIYIFRKKRALFNEASIAFDDKYYHDKLKTNKESSQVIQQIINNLFWIKRALANINIEAELSNAKHNDERINSYLEMVDYSLNFCFQYESDFDLFYRNSPKDLIKPWIHRLGIALELSMLLEKFLIISTLVVAASPMIMISVMPSLFAEAMFLITPLVIFLPPLTYAICALGLLIAGLKLAEIAMKQYAKKEDVKILSNLKDTKHEVAQRLLDGDDASSKMESSTKQRFFKTVEPLKAKELQLRKQVPSMGGNV
jgi:hypothetical protein